LGPKTRGGETPESISCKGESNSPCKRSSSLAISSGPQGREKLPRALDDDASSTLGVKVIEFFDGRHIKNYITQTFAEADHISQPTLGSSQGHFKIITSFCMYALRYTFSL